MNKEAEKSPYLWDLVKRLQQQAVLDFLNKRIKYWQNYQREYHHKQRGFQMATEMINEYKQQKQLLIKK